MFSGEHSSCGPNLHSSGFTYDPADFMKADIFFYNFAWKDFGEATMAGLLDMVKVLSFALSEGKVAVHCHAGIYLYFTRLIKYDKVNNPSDIKMCINLALLFLTKPV